MRLMLKLFPVLLIAGGLLLTKTTQAQSRDNHKTKLRVGGAVLDPKKGKALKGATVELRSGAKVLEKTTTDKSATFEYELNFDRVYTIYVMAEGYATQFVEVNTKGLNDQDKYYDYDYTGINMRLTTFKEGLDYSLFDEPVKKIQFDAAQQGFVVDEEHEKEFKDKQAKLATEIMKK